MSRRTLFIFSLVIIALGVASRFVPHLWNFTPLTAIALVMSAYVGVSYSIGIVLVTMILADLSLGFYEWHIMLAVYSSLVVSAFIGLLLQRKRTLLGVVTASTASSLIFFTVTNAAVWYFSGMYSHTFAGLLQCFIAALPFYRGTVIGDLFFTGIFFTIAAVVSQFSNSKNIQEAGTVSM